MSTHVYTHVYTHAYTHVRTRVYTHVYTHAAHMSIHMSTHMLHTCVYTRRGTWLVAEPDSRYIDQTSFSDFVFLTTAKAPMGDSGDYGLSNGATRRPNDAVLIGEAAVAGP